MSSSALGFIAMCIHTHCSVKPGNPLSTAANSHHLVAVKRDNCLRLASPNVIPKANYTQFTLPAHPPWTNNRNIATHASPVLHRWSLRGVVDQLEVPRGSIISAVRSECGWRDGVCTRFPGDFRTGLKSEEETIPIIFPRSADLHILLRYFPENCCNRVILPFFYELYPVSS